MDEPDERTEADLRTELAAAEGKLQAVYKDFEAARDALQARQEAHKKELEAQRQMNSVVHQSLSTALREKVDLQQQLKAALDKGAAELDTMRRQSTEMSRQLEEAQQLQEHNDEALRATQAQVERLTSEVGVLDTHMSKTRAAGVSPSLTPEPTPRAGSGADTPLAPGSGMEAGGLVQMRDMAERAVTDAEAAAQLRDSLEVVGMG